jgi:hypothetical protein
MRNFFKNLIAISVITLILMFFLDNFYSYAFKNGQPRSKIQNILQLKNKHYDVAFFGSSRTENNIDCKLITKLTGMSCANFGISGGSPGDMLILMKLAENRKISFNQVFMQVDYNYNSSGITKYFKANLIPFMDDPIVKDQLLLYKEEFFYRWIPFYRFMVFDKVVGIREATASFLKLRQNTNIAIGFSPKQGIGKATAGSFAETIKDKSQELTQMQKLYKNTNTTLEFFTSPYCKEVKNRDFMDKVQLKLPGLHNYVDLFDDKDEYFFNCGHLNEAGAGVFTKTLVKDLLQ